MTSATCEALPPFSLQIVDGRRVYRSEHLVAAINDTESDILYNVEAIMFDSLGHSASTSALNVAAQGLGSSASGPYFVDFDANLFSSGTEVEFTCETHVTGGFSAVDRKVNQLTIV
jgi:hypothetical protein